MPTAAALIIGNEILTGKVEEANLTLLARELFGLGIELRRVVVCPDDIDGIAADIQRLKNRFDYVITSGGVGPTHDDVTLKAVADAFDRPLVRSPELVTKIREMVGERCTEGHLRMADVPKGADLVSTPEVPWPSVVMGNVYVLPGVPRIFRMKLPLLRDRLAAGRRFYSRAVYTRCHEADIAEMLDLVVAAHGEVEIGSYPVMDGDYRVKLTVDSRSRSAADLAVAALVEALPSDAVVRVEGGRFSSGAAAVAGSS